MEIYASDGALVVVTANMPRATADSQANLGNVFFLFYQPMKQILIEMH